MITLVQFAEKIEDGLNAVLDNPDIQFKIWATAGQMTKSVRTGNSVTHYITGSLRTSTSSNDANVLVMGVNGLSLDLAIPLQAPKTSSEQTAQQLARVQNSQYPFVDLILAAIDGYFQQAQAFSLTDAEGIDYTIAMQAGRALTGNVNIAAVLGNAVTVSVFITAYFLQGGINSRNVVLSVDGVRMPLQSVNIGRIKRNNSDVYSSGETNIKNVATASALSFDFAFPANADNTTKQAIKELLSGSVNVAHFVELSYGNVEDELYFMTFDNLHTNPQGVTFAGISGSLIEVLDNPEIINVPDYFQIGYFTFSDSSPRTFIVQITPAADMCYANIAGRSWKVTPATPSFAVTIAVSVKAEDYIFDPDNDNYRLYVITSGEANVSGESGTTFTIVKEASDA